jgi:hypothetical protein
VLIPQLEIHVGDFPMHEYDLFEKFPDGSSLWRACVLGRKNARVILRQWAKQSKHQFYAINVKTAELVPLKLKRGADGFLVPATLAGTRQPSQNVA